MGPIESTKRTVKVPILLMGDFNEVLTPAKRRGAALTTLSMRQLRDLVFDLQLFDLEINQQFTWLRKNAAKQN